jgi:hypothetical protein
MRRRAEPSSRDQQVYQLLCWYQRAAAQYAQAVDQRPAAAFSADCELPADLREAWCKKSTPPAALLGGFPLPEPPPGPPAPPLDQGAIAELTRRAGGAGAGRRGRPPLDASRAALHRTAGCGPGPARLRTP